LASPRTISDFEVILTADGSPSLSIADHTGYVEKMHHSGGALSESLYIYGDALDEVLKRKWPLRVVSVGLGLGYNELIMAAKAVRHHIQPDQAALFSFEVEPVLVDQFKNWVLTGVSELTHLYEKILAPLSAQANVTGHDILSWLRAAQAESAWHIRRTFPGDAADVKQITCILYDAFSNKMSPELWSESVLNDAIESMSASNCILATYACTGSLKRALKHSKFERWDRRGFAGKRESTFAVREIAEMEW
jgi:tRNA 5-methylaminomethyl-2-thiouridine biosynthesis bifunctional protein